MILLLLTVIVANSNAQTFAEWFKQKKTQKKYLIEQIVALQTYITYVEKGYKIVKNGLQVIGDLKNGELNLHKDYFNSLKIVNPKIKNYERIADIMALQADIVLNCRKLRSRANKSGWFNQQELDYIGRVLARLLADGTATLDELVTLTTDGNLKMKDDERLKRIDRLYLDMTDQYSFIRQFSNETMELSASREIENKEVQTSRSLYGIKTN